MLLGFLNVLSILMLCEGTRSQAKESERLETFLQQAFSLADQWSGPSLGCCRRDTLSAESTKQMIRLVVQEFAS